MPQLAPARRSRPVPVLLGAVLCTLLVACSGAGPQPAPAPLLTETATPLPTSIPVPLPTPTPVPPRPEANAFPPALKQQALATLQRVAELRGTPPRGDVDMYLLTRAQARAYYAPDRPDPGSEPRSRPADPKQELYRLLGLIPDRADLAQQSLDNLIALITGFYDPRLDALYLLEEISGGLQGFGARATIVHELTHALQDQYYDLDRLETARAEDWDASTALRDVQEGDAVSVENAYFGFSTRASYRVPVCFTIPAPARSVPYIVERELDTWYEDGLCFVQAVAPKLLNGVSDIWENLPATTEQILHPDKYLAGEGAKPVVLPRLQPGLGEGWTLLAGNNFGEFGVQNLLLAGLATDRPRVQRAAAGWGGDAWALYTRDDDRLALSVIVWDDEAEAQEFWPAFVASLRNRAAGLELRGDSAFAAEVAGRFWRAAHAADRVTFVVSTDAATLDRAAARLGLP